MPQHIGDFFIIIIYQFQQVEFLAQILEWKAMLYLIETQKDRTLAEITYDFEHENIHDHIQPDQISYRRKEIRLYKCYKWFAIIEFSIKLVCAMILHSFILENYFDVKKKYIVEYCALFFQIETIFNCIFLSWYFMRIYFLMSKKYYYEF